MSTIFRTIDLVDVIVELGEVVLKAECFIRERDDRAGIVVQR
jgi:hypothetical protein